MGRAEQGDPLTTGLGILQPGWTVENDGYGLLTCKADFIRNNDGPISAATIRNLAFPGDSRLSMHKFAVNHITLGRIKITVDCVGIDETQPYTSNGWTRPIVTGVNGLSTEKIETHPNFFVTIAGNGPYTQSDKGPIITKPDKTNDRSYIGLNGACFERADGGRFIGFVDKSYASFYGKTSYLAPTTVWSGVVYTGAASDVNTFRARVGKASNNNGLGVDAYDFIPVQYGSPPWNGPNGPQLLVSKADAEEFGNLYKISYEVRYSTEGWDLNVYG